MGKLQNIPKLRFQEFNNEWQRTRIGQQASIVRGASPRPIKDPKWFNENSNVGWLRISDVTSQGGRIRYIKQRISKAGEAKTRVVTTPHLILSIAATVGEPAINYVKAGIHDGFLIFLDPKFNLEFMFQWLKSFKPKWRRYGQPGSQLNLNSTIVSRQRFLVPSLSEQRQIGKFFATLDKIISLQQKKCTLLKRLREAYLQKMFPRKNNNVPRLRFDGFNQVWKNIYLKDIAPVRGGGAFKSKSFRKDGVPVLRISNILKNNRVGGEFKFYTPSKSFNKYILSNGAVLIAMSGATVGKIAMIHSNEKYYQNQRVGYLNTKSMTDNCFLYSLCHSNKFFQNLNRIKVSGAQPNISSKDIDKFQFQIPSLPEQRLIGKFFKMLDNNIDYQDKKLSSLKKLKKAYLQKMFC